MPTGTIARLLIDKGFGFIRDEGGIEHFFHRSAVRGAVFELLREGQRVDFTAEESTKGPRAGESSTDRRLTPLQARPLRRGRGLRSCLPQVPPHSARLAARSCIVGLIALALVVYGALNVGRFLTKEDSIHKADVIAVLAGTRFDRPLEAADLYQAGCAPRL